MVKQPTGKRPKSRHRARARCPSSMGDIESEQDEDSILEDKWPKAAHLSLGGLMQQNQVIHEICRDAIKIVELTLVTQDAWPELHKGAHYKRQVLLDAIQALRAKFKNNNNSEQGKPYKIIQDRISKDETFVRTVGKWVSNFLYF
jgi:hypothetical protein